MAWLALSWKLFGQAHLVTRCAMLLLAAFSLVGYFRLSRTVANTTVAAASTALTAIYPVFFTQSSLAHVDLPAAGLIFWGLQSYVRGRRGFAILWFSLAVLAKETAILAPLALFLWELVASRLARREGTTESRALPKYHGLIALRESVKATALRSSLLLLIPGLPLAAWYAYHYARTGFVFGNPEFFRYNVQATVHPLRIFLALLIRVWQTFGYLNLYLLTLACILAMRYAPIEDEGKPRSRIEIPIQAGFLAIVIAYIAALAVIGGAVLDRYMLPVVPLVILVCVSTIWRRLKLWPAMIMIAFVALAFVAALFVNPPYSFSPEDNLTYRDYILLHQRAADFLATRYPHARVLTAWPASDELSQPYLGYVQKPMQAVRIDDFSVEQVLSAADARSRFDVALVFSTKYEPHSIFDRWKSWRKWRAQYFDYHVDLTPGAIASVLDGSLVYVEYKRGEWVGIVELQKVEEARLKPSAAFDNR
jgi:Dolichyl-phosphate-mannose-protein mannosyltransferase